MSARVIAPADIPALGILSAANTWTALNMFNSGVSVIGATSLKYKLSSIDANARDFNLTAGTFTNTTDPRNNAVTNFGYNVSPNGTREDVTDAALRIAFESYYEADATTNQEFHVESIDLSGTGHRIITAKMPRNGTAGNSSMQFGIDTLPMSTYAGVNKVQWNLFANNLTINSGFTFNFGGNNAAQLFQRNAANNAYLALPYYDATNRMKLDAAAQIVGDVPTTGTYANVFLALQATSGAANGSGVGFTGPNLSGVDYKAFKFLSDISAGTFEGQISNTSNTSASDASMRITTAGASARNPYVRFEVSGVYSWYNGIDNADAGQVKWSYNNKIGNADKMILDVSGNLTVIGRSQSVNLKATGTQIDFTNLPTADPHVVSRLWANSGVLTVSAG